jgi:hypothetical protein
LKRLITLLFLAMALAAPLAHASSVTSADQAAGVMAQAPNLPRAADFTGASILDTRLSDATYALTKLIGAPKTLDVACWSQADWAEIATDDDPVYSTTALYSPRLPHWVHLSPAICRAMETLLRNRPVYPNIYTADAVTTLTHEMVHALGVQKEAPTECFAMQLTPFMARELHVPEHYAIRLGQLSLENYRQRPANYRDESRCREDGIWDLFKNEPSPPWHT